MVFKIPDVVSVQNVCGSELNLGASFTEKMHTAVAEKKKNKLDGHKILSNLMLFRHRAVKKFVL